MQNIGKLAGSITAAQFIGLFIETLPSAHFIAGVAWADGPRPYTPKGVTGFGVMSKPMGEQPRYKHWLRGYFM